MSKTNYFIYVTCTSLMIWGILLASRIFSWQEHYAIGKLASQMEMVVNIFILIPTFRIYKNMGRESRAIFSLLLITNIGLTLSDIAWYSITYLNYPVLLDIRDIHLLLDVVPFYIWTIAIIIFLCKLLNKYILHQKYWKKILLIFMIIDIITISLFLSSIHYSGEAFSAVIALKIIFFVTYLAVFDFVILSMIYADSRGLILFLSGIVILISGDFFAMYSSFSFKVSNFLSYGELLFLLGLQFNCFGAFVIYKDGDYEIKNWVRKDTTIKSKLTFWCFSGGIASFLLFFTLAYVFNIIDQKVFLGLPPFIMLYSVVVVTFSLYVGKHFEIPFKQLTNNIKLQTIASANGLIDDRFVIEEFIFLQKFITDAFVYKEEKEAEKIKLERQYAQSEHERAKAIQALLKEEKLKNEALYATTVEQARFREVAAQVAHDIASPIFALRVILPSCDVLPENTRSVLNKFSIRIIDIAQNFLSQFKQTPEAGVTINGITRTQSLVYSELTEIITEKKYEYNTRPIKFVSEINPNSYFTFINVDVDAFKRMISNIINNSVDALEDKEGSITIKLATIDDKVQIIIEDNGKGMSKEVADKIMNNVTVTSGKIDGHGIGFSQIRDTLASNEGVFNIESELGRGTKVTLTFPKIETPAWITDKIELKPDDLVVIVDDEPYVHEAWECQFRTLSSPYVRRKHFEQGSEAISFLNQLTEEEKKNVLLLTDYELLKQKLNGLDIINKTKIERAILVTSHHNSQKIRERAANLEVKILPKELAFAVILKLDHKVNQGGHLLSKFHV
ncbi:MAG: kinD [Burkholderiales bacterium]|nr:kinD [Burkholderiales bacterium]